MHNFDQICGFHNPQCGLPRTNMETPSPMQRSILVLQHIFKRQLCSALFCPKEGLRSRQQSKLETMIKKLIKGTQHHLCHSFEMVKTDEVLKTALFKQTGMMKCSCPNVWRLSMYRNNLWPNASEVTASMEIFDHPLCDSIYVYMKLQSPLGKRR